MSGIPQDWVPLFEWSKRHYDKQALFIKGIQDHWTNMFLAANGTGKTHILYWTLTSMTLGFFPYHKANPPLKVKILVTDFEHGLNTIAKETLLDTTYLPDGSEIGPILPESSYKTLWNKDDKSIRFHNGSVWHFMTSEQQRKLHSGTNFDVLACDEEPAEGAYDESLRGLRTAKAKGRVLLSLTPPYEEGKGPSWTKFRLYEPFLNGDKSVNVVTAAMAENPSITPRFIEEFSKGKTEEQLQVQLYGRYPSYGKVCFPYFQKKMWDPTKGEGNLLPRTWETPLYDDTRYKFFMSLDYHDSKPPAAIWAVEKSDGDIVIYDELHPLDVDNRTVNDVAAQIMQIEGDEYFSNRVVKRIGDPKMKDTSNALIRGFNAWDYFRRCGIRLKEGYNRDPGISYAAINEYLRGDRKNHPRLFIRENCVNLIKALDNHYWMKDGSPDPKFSDYIVCIKYVIQTRKPNLMHKKDRRDKYPLSSFDAVGKQFSYGRTLWR